MINDYVGIDNKQLDSDENVLLNNNNNNNNDEYFYGLVPRQIEAHCVIQKDENKNKQTTMSGVSLRTVMYT